MEELTAHLNVSFCSSIVVSFKSVIYVLLLFCLAKLVSGF